MEILKEIAEASTFQVECFGGKLLIEGRILTAPEIEQIGLGSSLLAQEVLISNKAKGINTIDQIREKASKEGMEGLEESELMRLLDFAKSIRPETIARISEDQDKILCKVIKRASQDQGLTWENITLCHAMEQMNADNNVLWVGVFTSDDRNNIINKAMQGQQEAVERLKRFQGRP
tara:strand:+ start:1651 stop:2178 length:528 start_codon:yes stop_codon:yes gene_type:complete